MTATRVLVLAASVLALSGCTNDTFTRIGFPNPITDQGKVTLSLWKGSWIAGMLVGCVVWGLIIWGNGQTPALQVLGMRVWRPAENQVANFWQMALREVVGRLAESILGIFTQLTSFVLFLTGLLVEVRGIASAFG